MHDATQAQALLHGDETDVFGDAGYQGVGKREENLELPNRQLLLDRLSLALPVSARSRQYGAVLFLDLDKFKTLNDTQGHDYGDMLLIEVAKRLKPRLSIRP